MRGVKIPVPVFVRVGESREPRPVRVDHPDLLIQPRSVRVVNYAPVTRKHDLAAVRRPARAITPDPRRGKEADVRAVGVHQVDAKENATPPDVPERDRPAVWRVPGSKVTHPRLKVRDRSQPGAVRLDPVDGTAVRAGLASREDDGAAVGREARLVVVVGRLAQQQMQVASVGVDEPELP